MILMRLIGDRGITNALTAGWISIDNLWMMTGLWIVSERERSKSLKEVF
ncbi:MAG: hypothetical protein K5648_08985 [Erysipelotrichaceae bacterium]|nr:hypothetical protein [Erysipelotrichaceae bacterium]